MPFQTIITKSRWTFGLSAIIVLLGIALIYWPVAHAQFVWDDILDFQQMAWLRHGNDWQHLIFQRFNDWAAYFRPLGVALFTIEVRIFDVKPGPMHLVSLFLHLINTLLVGILAARISSWRVPRDKRIYAFVLPMLLYGLHPVLIEPVVWIGCQFDLLATLFMLLGWWSGMSTKRPLFRAVSVSICFFLAACAKESAIAFLPVLVVLDWFALGESSGVSKLAQVRTLLIDNAVIYVAVFLAGIVYLILRHWSLGAFIPETAGKVLPAWARLQEASFLYLRYWRMFFWPSVDMGPVHPVPLDQFHVFSAWALIRDVAALGLSIGSFILVIRRSCVGGLILCVAFALFPVLHIIAANFDSSLYHERYAMTALAVACAWLPLALSEITPPVRMRRTLTFAAIAGFSVWTVLAAMTINVTVPLWSTQLKLWQWALQENPGFIDAEDQLIAAYINAGEYGNAWRLIDEIMKDNKPCVDCMLNAATLALRQNNAERASLFLKKIKDSLELYESPTSYRIYLTAVASLQLVQDKPVIAEQVARLAISRDHLDPSPQLVLAEALVLQGKVREAKQVEEKALLLMEPVERPAEARRFAHLLKVAPIPPAKSP